MPITVVLNISSLCECTSVIQFIKYQKACLSTCLNVFVLNTPPTVKVIQR